MLLQLLVVIRTQTSILFWFIVVNVLTRRLFDKSVVSIELNSSSTSSNVCQSNNYGKGDNKPTIRSPNVISKSDILSLNQTMDDYENEAYDKVGEELETNKVDRALWTKAFALADGDDKQTRVLYIKSRVKKIMSEAIHSHPTDEKSNFITAQRTIEQKRKKILLENLLDNADHQIDMEGYETIGDLVYAASVGNSNAKFLIGCMYRDGEVLMQDMEEAEHWFKKAALEGDEPAFEEYNRLKTQHSDVSNGIFSTDASVDYDVSEKSHMPITTCQKCNQKFRMIEDTSHVSPICPACLQFDVDKSVENKTKQI